MALNCPGHRRCPVNKKKKAHNIRGLAQSQLSYVTPKAVSNIPWRLTSLPEFAQPARALSNQR